MRASRRNRIVYAARIWREGKPDLVRRGDLGEVRAYATRKLRQHLTQQIALMLKCIDAGLADPLSTVLVADHVRIEQDAWGGAIRYKGRLMHEGWGGSYHVVVD